VRLLYDGRSEELHDGRSLEPPLTHRFRVAIAFLPPEALRVEIYPPVGGARLILTGDGSRLLALEPQEKRFETLDPGSEGLARLVGVALDARALMALLSGASPCPHEEGAAPPQTCSTARWRFQRSGPEALFAGERGETLLALTYHTDEKGGWPVEIRFSWPGRSVVDLRLKEGPGGGDGLEASAFRTEAPPGFVPGAVLSGGPGAPSLGESLP
jgi:hypothetical protein